MAKSLGFNSVVVVVLPPVLERDWKTHLVAGIWSRHHNIYKRNFFLYFNFITNKYLIAREFKTIFRYIIIITASVQEITKTVVIKIKIALISNQ